MQGSESEFWAERPEPSAIERELINLFWRLRRETNRDSVIKSHDIKAELKSVCIENDIGLAIIQAADDHYLMLLREEMRRKAKK